MVARHHRTKARIVLCLSESDRVGFGRTRWRVVVIRGLWLCGMLTFLACAGRGEALAQDTAAQEAHHRATVIAQLPPDAAKVLFGRESTPTEGPPQFF